MLYSQLSVSGKRLAELSFALHLATGQRRVSSVPNKPTASTNSEGICLKVLLVTCEAFIEWVSLLQMLYRLFPTWILEINPQIWEMFPLVYQVSVFIVQNKFLQP